MVTRRLGGGLSLAFAIPLASLSLAGGCLSTPANDYLYSCANGQRCPIDTSCASDNLCHPVYVPGAGPADAGSYFCAMTSPQCPDGQTCGADSLCSGGGVTLPDAGDAGSSGLDAGDAGSSGLDAGDAGNGKPCDLATAFPGSSTFACGTGCAGLGVGDFNHDGFADLVVAVDPDNNNNGGVALLLNDGTGSFGSPRTTRTQYLCGNDPEFPDYTSPDAFAVADFNGDGWPDLGLSLQQSAQLAVAINDQHGGFTVGAFQPAASPSCGFPSGYSDITTYQSGGGTYLAALGYGLLDPSDTNVVALSRVQSAGTSLDAFAYLEPASDYLPVGLTVGVFANDPNPSALVAEENLDTAGGQIELFSGTGSGSLDRLSSPGSQTLIGQLGTTWVTSADLDGDGLLDLIATNDLSDTVEIYYAKDGGFRPGVSFPVDYSTDTSDAGAEPAGVIVADLDGDGRADIATANFNGSISILKGLTDGGFLLVAMKPTTSQGAFWISAVDLKDHGANDGGLPDLVVSYQSATESNAVDVFFNACRQ